MNNKTEHQVNRRQFLKTIGLGVGVTAVSASALAVIKQEQVVNQIAMNKKVKIKTQGYQESQHVLDYYNSL